MTQRICGVDVAKVQLDVYLEDGAAPRTWTVPNTAAGHRALMRALPADTLVVLEPTGPYHEAVVERLTAAGVAVRLVNPARVHRFVQARGHGAKTDRLDAAALAQFAAAIPGALYAPPSPARRQLRALHTRLRQLADMLAAEACRLEQTRDRPACASVRRVVRTLEAEHERITTQADALIRATPDLHADATLLQTIPGVGPVVARALLAELPDLRTFRDAAQLAAFVGLAPVVRQSGTSLRRAALPAGGKPRLRATLFLPALSATRYNPDVRALYQRLLARGKPKKLAVAACMHKLLRIAYGVLTHHTPFQPHTA